MNCNNQAEEWKKVLGTLENGVKTGKSAFLDSVWAGAVIDGALRMPQAHWEAIVQWKLAVVKTLLFENDIPLMETMLARMSTKHHLFIFTFYFYIVLDQWFLIILCLLLSYTLCFNINLSLLLNNYFLISLLDLYYVDAEGCFKEMVSCFQMKRSVGPRFPSRFSLKYF